MLSCDWLLQSCDKFLSCNWLFYRNVMIPCIVTGCYESVIYGGGGGGDMFNVSMTISCPVIGCYGSVIYGGVVSEFPVLWLVALGGVTSTYALWLGGLV